MKKHEDLFETVQEYGKGTVPMHMPGHKRNTRMLGDDLPYGGDITEIDGFDDLHDPDGGILTVLARRAAELYGAKQAFPLVNGSTGGILAAIRAMTRRGDKILVPRNCHKSVYYAVELCGLHHVPILPPVDEATGLFGSLRPEEISAALRAEPEIRAVVVTSPTYEGVASDIAAIAETVHAHGARLIVDAAHGAHLNFSDDFPTFPKESDIVITSLHKTLPSLTQTALALVYAEDSTLSDALARELRVFETSSPSYVLLASIDRCISLLEREAATLFADYSARLDRFYRGASSLRHLSVLTGSPERHPSFYGFDRGKLVIFSRSPTLNGTELADRLRREFSIEPEMAYTDYVLCMTSICDSDEDLDRLRSALYAIDASLSGKPVETARRSVPRELPERIIPIDEALRLPPAPLTAGEISRAYAWVYPPGIPLIVPGEAVTSSLLSTLSDLEACGLKVRIGR